LARFWLVLAFAAIGFRCDSPSHAQEPAPDAPRNATEAPSDARAEQPPLDLARVRGYDLTVLAITGEAIGNENARVSAIRGFSLNDRGQVAFMTEKNGGGDSLPVDLHISDGRTTRLVARQRAEVPTTGPTMRWIEGFALNDAGHLLIRAGRESRSQSEKHLWLFDGEGLSEIPRTKEETSSEGDEQIWTRNWVLPSNRFAINDRGDIAVCRYYPETILIGDLAGLRVLADSRNDPSDTAGNFSGFTSIFGINNRRQVLFSAARGRDTYDFERLFRYDPPDASADVRDPASGGTFHELVRMRGRLRGTSLLLDDGGGHVPYDDAALNERGQVVMTAQVCREATIRRFEEELDAILLCDISGRWKLIAMEGEPVSEEIGTVRSLSRAVLNSSGQIAFLVDVDDQEMLVPLRYEADGRFTVMAHNGQPVVPSSTLRYVLAPYLADGGLMLMKAVLAPADEIEPPNDRTYPTDIALVISDGRTLVEVFRLETEIRGSEAEDYHNQAGSIRDAIDVNRLGQVAFVVELLDERQALCLCSPRLVADDSP
jgi:hypothetical protein